MSKKIMLTKHFSIEEMACKCGCGSTTMDVDAMAKFELLRTLYGKPLNPSSGGRCQAHNKAIGGAVNSEHISDEHRDSTAVDFYITGAKERGAILSIAFELGFGGIGVSSSFVHLDNRKSAYFSGGKFFPIVWTY